MTEVVTVMRGHTLTWWLWWCQRHSQVDWESFTIAFLWHFKTEYRDVLPILNEEEESELESQQSTAQVGRVVVESQLLKKKSEISTNFLEPISTSLDHLMRTHDLAMQMASRDC